MVKNVCETYLKSLKGFHFKLFLALALASGATRPCLGVSEHHPNPPVPRVKNKICVATATQIIFLDQPLLGHNILRLLMFYQIFLSPQVKEIMIISNKHGI